MQARLHTGEEAHLGSIQGNVLTFRSRRAFAPGSPIRFSISSGDEERLYEGRAIGSKRVERESFEVRMRFVNLRRDDRDFLQTRLGDS